MYLPSFVDITMNGTVLEQTAVVSSLSGGTVVGKLLGAIFLGCLNPAKDRAEVTTRFVFQSVAMLWGAGYVITVCSWLSCSAVPNTIAMAFFLGLFGGGISICIHVAAYVSSIDLIDNTKPAGLMSFLAFSQSIGQALSTLISHYAMADAHWGFVYIAIAFGGATWLVFLILPQFAPRPRT